MMLVLEIFSCSGGMAEGLRRAGIPVTMAFDQDQDACDSYAHNIGHRPVQMDARDLLRMVQSGWSPGEIDLLVADPPCTPWSRAGKKLGTADERDMLELTVQIVRLLGPRAYLIANIPGLDDGPNLPVVQRTIGSLSRDLCGAKLCRADLVGADLRHVKLSGADLFDAELRGADLSYGDILSCVPRVDRLHARMLEAFDAGGVLEMYNWHKCETTHCRAGWAIHLAGDAGRELEERLGPGMAGALISVASCPALEGKVPDFYASTDDALADIRRLAALESA